MLPNWGIKLYGGSTFLYNNKLIVSTRNSENRSRLSLYKIEINKHNSNYSTSLLRESLLDNNEEYYMNSLGQSYPFLIEIKSIKILFFTDWYYDKFEKKILNRLVISQINNKFEIQKMHIFETGIFSKAGAIRAYLIQNHIEVFIPIFKDFSLEFPNYFIHKFQFELEINETFNSLIEKLINSKGTLILTGFDKTTCFNIVDSRSLNSMNYDVIFSARNNNEKYNLYLGNVNNKSKLVSDLSIFEFDDSLTYPSLSPDGNDLRLICSLGSYGDKGIILSNFKR